MLSYAFVRLSRVRAEKGFQPWLHTSHVLVYIEPADVGLSMKPRKHAFIYASIGATYFKHVSWENLAQ